MQVYGTEGVNGSATDLGGGSEKAKGLWLFTLSEGSQLPMEEDETFCEVTCLFPDTGAPSSFESSPSASKRSSGSGFASGWTGTLGCLE